MYIYIDESADLGFDFSKPRTSRFFVGTALVINNRLAKKRIEKAVKRTLKNKIKRRVKGIAKFKGTLTNINEKKYFYKLIKDEYFRIYTIVLDKKVLPKGLHKRSIRDQIVWKYHFQKMPFFESKTAVVVTIHRSRRKEEREWMNVYLRLHIRAHVPPFIPIDIYHRTMEESKGLQAVDVFCWGVYRKYEKKDAEWYNVYKDKVDYEDVYPKKMGSEA